MGKPIQKDHSKEVRAKQDRGRYKRVYYHWRDYYKNGIEFSKRLKFSKCKCFKDFMRLFDGSSVVERVYNLLLETDSADYFSHLEADW